MITIRFVKKPGEGSTMGYFARDAEFATLKEANEAIRKVGAAPGQWLDLPGERIKIAWL